MADDDVALQAEAVWTAVRRIAADGGDAEAALPTVVAAIGVRRVPVDLALEVLRRELEEEPGSDIARESIVLLERVLESGVFR